MTTLPDLCPEDTLTRLGELATGDTAAGLRRTEALLGTYAEDPRLHFLKGSLLAALQRYGDATPAMRRAVELAPGFQIARFQLGLLLLTSGLPADAAEIWRPLDAPDASPPLRLFAAGLQHMAADQFVDAERLLREGIAQNEDNPALNNDMQMVIDQMRAAAADAPGSGESSPTDWLLRVSASKPTKH